MVASDGWVIPEQRALSRRPLSLGLPFGVVCVLLAVVALTIIFKLFVAGGVLLVTLWGLGAAITHHDPFAWEILLAMARLPGVLRAR